jgi:uncharacterized protein YbjT (DUF2867 family)
MSIVVTTPTGNIGSVVTRALLDAGERPVLVARHPEKLEDAVARGATVVQGDHGDAAMLTEATQGAEALFVCVPGNLQLDDIHAFYGRFAGAAAEAATANGIAHVVAISSAGADRERGNGPVAGLYLLEQILGDAGLPNLTLLRPGYFMENTLAQIPGILQADRLFTTFPAGTRFPMIATRDIGARAAEILLARETASHRVVELQGGLEISYEEVASVLSEVLERPIEHVTVPGEQLVGALTGMGVSRVLAEALVELNEAIASGHVAHREPRGAASSTPTDYPTFAREVFRPAFQGAMAAEA